METVIIIKLLISITFIFILLVVSQIHYCFRRESPSMKSLAILGQNFSDTFAENNHNIMNNNNNKMSTDLLFPRCEEGKDDCRHLALTVYDGLTGSLLLESRESEGRIYPNADQIPQTCGFGKLVYYSQNKTWNCVCHAPSYFNGPHCDEPQPTLTRTNKCSAVAKSTDLSNRDISTFNPFLEGVCVECSIPNAVPILTALEPLCRDDNNDINSRNVEMEEMRQNPCFYDALNPQKGNSSPFNKFVEGYGCVCDYQNGFVEVRFNREKNNNDNIISDACVKFGVTDQDDFHRADLAYYTFQNDRNPIQVHSYTQLESPFDNSDIFFPSSSSSSSSSSLEFLVKQPSAAIVHSQDWLNRNISPTKTQKIRRLNYPRDNWPIVDKIHLINSYERRNETNPVDAYTLVLGRGFETKHFYEVTNKRWLTNAVWGHPVIYTYLGDPVWYGKVTLNPIGAELKYYYGLTMKTKPGEIVRLDTRGYDQEKEETDKVLTLPPSYIHEMMDPDKIVYLPFLYNNYVFDK